MRMLYTEPGRTDVRRGITWNHARPLVVACLGLAATSREETLTDPRNPNENSLTY